MVVIAVIAVLVGLVVPALASARRSAAGTQASAASRTLMQAYMMYATEHKSLVIPGYLPAIMNGQPIGILDEWGNAFQGPLAERWVYRLAPYFDYKWAGTTHVNTRADQLRHQQDILDEGGPSLWAYHVSVFPSFGINFRFVGGNYANTSEIRKNYHIRRIDAPFRPDHLIAFASARFWNAQPGQPLGELIDGFHRVEPPPLDATYRESDSPPMFGCVHPRYDGKVLASFLDGHAGLITKTQAVDRTFWSDPAARLGRADWEP